MISKEDAVKLQENFDRYVKDILITIVIPCYNHPQYLRRALSSLVAQTCDKFVITVVDDCSDKNIRRVCERYAGHLLINYVRMGTNVGAGMARQQGIDVCKTPYVTFLDADDTLAPNAVLTWDHLIRDNLKSDDPDIDIIVSRFIYENKADRKSIPFSAPVTTDDLLEQTKAIQRENMIENRVYGFDDGFSFLCAKVYRMGYLAEHLIQFFPVRTVEDTSFNTQAFSFHPVFYNDETVLYHWHDTPEGLHNDICYEDQIIATSYTLIPLTKAGVVTRSIPFAKMICMLYNAYYERGVNALTGERAEHIRELLCELVRNIGGERYWKNKAVRKQLKENAHDHALSIQAWLKRYNRQDEVNQ